MKYTAPLCLIAGVLVLLQGAETPVSSKGVEGKSVYIPVAQSIKISEEARIQIRDYNTTRLGGTP